MTLGQQIKKERRAQGFGQRQFAQLCGVPSGYLCEIEHDERNPTLRIINKIAAGLGLTLELTKGREP